MKIFLVVGTQEPFDRLVKEVDDWAENMEGIELFGQIGEGKYIPQNMSFKKILPPNEFNRILEDSDLIITHAGMGIILKSLVAGKPILVLPRRLALRELNTDHQIATATALEGKGYIQVAWDNSQLLEALNNLKEIRSKKTIPKFGSEMLLNTIHTFIQDLPQENG